MIDEATSADNNADKKAKGRARGRKGPTYPVIRWDKAMNLNEASRYLGIDSAELRRLIDRGAVGVYQTCSCALVLSKDEVETLHRSEGATRAPQDYA